MNSTTSQVPLIPRLADETRRRERVALEEALRAQVVQMISEMHELYRRGYTPKVKPGKHCNACSLKELCLPVLCRSSSARTYIRQHVREADS